MRPKRVAIVHDWLNGMRGGEKTLEAILELFPQADLFTLLLERDKVSPAIARKKITTSFIQRMPLAKSNYRHWLPLFPIAVERFDLSGYDLVLSTSHCVAKGARAPQEVLHICYCFSPMRYIWLLQKEYFGKNPVTSLTLRPLLAGLRRWDVRSCRRVDHFVAISRTVAHRILSFYGRESEVIFPPVDTDFFVPGETERDFFLIVSALVPYKRIDLAVKAFNRLRLPLVIIGDGPEYSRLRRLAGTTVSFRGWVSNQEVREAYQTCRALVFPGVEDFGLTPVEAQACGKPVLAFGKGGVTESLEHGVTGLLFQEQSVTSLMASVSAFERMTFNPATARERSLRFSRQVFKNTLSQYITRRCDEFHIDKR